MRTPGYTLCFRIKKNLSTLEAKVSILFPNHVYDPPQGGGSIRENSKTTSEESLLTSVILRAPVHTNISPC